MKERNFTHILSVVCDPSDLPLHSQTVCYVTDPALLEPCSALMTSSLTSSLHCAVVVPGLPRGAAVEWHVWTHARNAQFQSECELYAGGGAMGWGWIEAGRGGWDWVGSRGGGGLRIGCFLCSN